jgi:hypothetical protein
MPSPTDSIRSVDTVESSTKPGASGNHYQVRKRLFGNILDIYHADRIS